MRVLVTNAKNRIAYNIVRSLSVKGVEVYCADFVPRAMSFYSKYSAGHFIYPSPFSAQEQFVECLIAKIRELKIDVLIPVYEELFLVAKHREELSTHVKMAVPDYQQILTAHNKDCWEPIARQLQIPVPRTFAIERFLSDPGSIVDLPFPVLIKPKQGGGGWGIKRVASTEEFNNFLTADARESLPCERFLVQELVEGDTLCVAMVFSHSQLRGKVAYRQIREYPVFGGQATCRISVSNKTAEGSLQKLLEHLAWHGVCQADFVVDRVTKVPYLIDINPRFWGSLAQGIASGVDFPYLIYQIALNGDVEPVEGFREGVMTRWLGGELRGFFQHYSQAKEKLPLLRDFFFPENSTVLFDDISLRDPVPFLVWGVDSLYRVAKFKRLKPHESLAGVWE
jgi:predicted ATP-grasp superfamily ATP-dependent carboligase